MKKLAVFAALLLFGAVLTAGTPSGWIDDFAKAQELARAEKRPMLVLFTGSDWCPYCVKLHKEVLAKAAFKKFAASRKLVLVYLDFPRKSKMPAETMQRNRKLASQYEVGGYPTTILFGADGKEAGRLPGYSKQYIERLTRMLDK